MGRSPLKAGLPEGVTDERDGCAAGLAFTGAEAAAE